MTYFMNGMTVSELLAPVSHGFYCSVTNTLRADTFPCWCRDRQTTNGDKDAVPIVNELSCWWQIKPRGFQEIMYLGRSVCCKLKTKLIAQEKTA